MFKPVIRYLNLIIASLSCHESIKNIESPNVDLILNLNDFNSLINHTYTIFFTKLVLPYPNQMS